MLCSYVVLLWCTLKLEVHLVTRDCDSMSLYAGLGHSYSRAKVKFNVHRADNMIIQSISLLDQLDKDINTFAMRIRCVDWSNICAKLSSAFSTCSVTAETVSEMCTSLCMFNIIQTCTVFPLLDAGL